MMVEMKKMTIETLEKESMSEFFVLFLYYSSHSFVFMMNNFIILTVWKISLISTQENSDILCFSFHKRGSHASYIFINSLIET